MEINQTLANKDPRYMVLASMISVLIAFIIIVSGIFPYYDLIILLLTGCLFFWYLSLWFIFRKYEIMGAFIKNGILIAFFIFIFLYFIFSILNDLNSLPAIFLMCFLPLAIIILRVRSYESFYDMLDYRTIYFRTVSNVFIGILFIVIYLIIQNFFSSIYPLFILSYAFLYSSFVLMLIGVLHSFVNNRKRIISMPSSFITIRRSKYILISLFDGILLGIYQNSNGVYPVLMILLIVITLLYVISDFLLAVYHSLVPVNEKYVVSSFKKFDRKEQISLITNVNSISKSIEEFEKYGKKDKLIMNLTAYLSEKGRTVQEVETAIKPLISYTPPNSLLLGLHGNRKNVEWELRKRVDLVSRILSELKQV